MSLGVNVVTDEEACAILLVEAAFHRRDALAREYSREMGIALPAWVGTDA